MLGFAPSKHVLFNRAQAACTRDAQQEAQRHLDAFFARPNKFWQSAAHRCSRTEAAYVLAEQLAERRQEAQHRLHTPPAWWRTSGLAQAHPRHVAGGSLPQKGAPAMPAALTRFGARDSVATWEVRALPCTRGVEVPVLDEDDGEGSLYAASEAGTHHTYERTGASSESERPTMRRWDKVRMSTGEEDERTGAGDTLGPQSTARAGTGIARAAQSR